MVELKLGLAGLVFAALSQFADSALQTVVLVGAVAAALLSVATLARRGYMFAKKIDSGVDLLFHLGERLDLIEQNGERTEGRFRAIEKRMDHLHEEVAVSGDA